MCSFELDDGLKGNDDEHKVRESNARLKSIQEAGADLSV